MRVQGWSARRLLLGAGLALGFATVAIWLPMHAASASGEARTLSLYNVNTKERLTVTYKKDGRYIPDAMKQLNRFMRDWRRDVSREMDPELVDLIWTLHQQLGSKEPVHLISGYRSEATNSKLRRTKGGQAKKSQHILGKAADIHFPDVPVKALRNSALVQEVGGVGYYPTSGIPFVHVDTGRVRMWPRIPRLELAALFPSGRTQYLPSDGKPITSRDYKLALAKAKQRGETLVASAPPPPAASPLRAAAQPAVASESTTAGPVLASYSPQAPLAPVTTDLPSASPAGPSKGFALASAAGGFPFASPAVERGSFPLYRGADVVSAPEVDEDHPDMLSYAPFETASLMADESVAYSHAAAPLTHPEQRDLSYVFEDMDRPLPATFGVASDYRGLAAAQRFSGNPVRSLYTELKPPAPTRIAQAMR